jgi:protein tyrosine/serine phosphatase
MLDMNEDKNFDIACQLADDLYFKFIDNLSDDIASEFVIDDKDNIGCTKNTQKGSELYWEIENTIKDTLDKR